MPRVSRISLNSKFFHAIVQGIEKNLIFDSPTNMKKYVELISKNSQRTNVIILSYCIMHNHAHLLIYSKKIDNLIKFFRCTNTSYAKYFNFKNKRVGYVFRDRYKTQDIYTIKQLVNTINYIHNNPVKAGICSIPEEYEYSSYNEYLTDVTDTSVVNKKILFRHFGKDAFDLNFLNRNN